MRVSVIIPAYNEEALIHHTLDSLRNQDYRGEMEVIVVDNQCTDGTVRIAKEWGVRVVREERRGYVYALMCGFEHASGEILITTDADTLVPQDWVSTLVRAFDRDAQVVAVGGMVEFYDANWKGNLYARCVLPSALACERLCFDNPHLWGANMAVRREAFLKAGGWTGKFNLQADTDLSRRLARIGKVAMIKSLKVSTSARRYNHRLLANLFVYGVNFLGLQLFHRPVFFEFKAVRATASNSTEGRPSRYRKWPVFYVIALAVVLSSSGARIEARPLGHATGGYIKHIATQNKVIALAFDDGPNKPYASQVQKTCGQRCSRYLLPDWKERHVLSWCGQRDCAGRLGGCQSLSLSSFLLGSGTCQVSRPASQIE